MFAVCTWDFEMRAPTRSGISLLFINFMDLHIPRMLINYLPMSPTQIKFRYINLEWMFLDRLLTYQRPQFLAYYPSVCKLDKYKQVFANIQYSLLITVAMIRCLTLIIMVSTSSTTSLTIPSYTAASLVWTSPLLRLVWSSMSHLQPSHNNLLRSTLKPDHNFKIIPNLAPLGQYMN